MSLIVVKFGGTSVADLEKIKNGAGIIRDLKEKGSKVVVVVSAMAGATNKLVGLCLDLSSINSHEKREEYDAALSTGETLCASLFALALQELGVNSKSLQGWQVKIRSNDAPSAALITDIDIEFLNSLLNNGVVPVITGFQAISQHGRTTTIGRGGSDTTAAALASAIKADFCDIYTDVDGVYTSDPRLVHDALLINKISYEETLELAGIGAKVLHPRSVEICMRYNIPLRIFSSSTKKTGTIIMSNIDEIRKITAISYLKKLAIIKIRAGSIDFVELISQLSKNKINLYQIIRIDAELNVIALQFEYLERIKELLNDKLKNYKQDVEIVENVGSIGVVGAGIRHDSEILLNILNILRENNTSTLYISNSEIKVILYLYEEDIEQCVKLLHTKLIKNE